jgi:hypothetical protein
VSLHEHTPHPHAARRREQGPVTVAGQSESLNERLARRGTLAFGTMWAFYLFVVYGALGAIFVSEQAALLYWSNWIQLWSLPLLMVGAVVLGQAADKRAQQTFDDVSMLMHDNEQLRTHLAAQDRVLTFNQRALLALAAHAGLKLEPPQESEVPQ